ncbi:MAG: ParB/RepB/Spo0J family partition protein [Gammaproteobacteria bacterium]
MSKRKALGSGLDSLLSSAANTSKLDVNSNESETLSIPLHKIIKNKHQPRKVFKEQEIKDLADSIAQNGQIAPVVVRESGNQYELIVGERRWRATQLLNKETISAIIVDVDEKTSAVMSIVENVQREDLNPMEEAESLKRLIDEFDMTHDDVSKYISKSRTHVSNLIRLNELCAFGKDQLRIGTISMGHARAVLSLDISEQTKIIKEAVKLNLSVRAVEALCKSNQKTSVNRHKDPDTAILERQLTDLLAAKTSIKHTNNGGNITIKYRTMNELQGIIEKIRKIV